MSGYHIIHPKGIRTDAGNGRTSAELAPIGGNRTTVENRKFINGIPRIPQ